MFTVMQHKAKLCRLDLIWINESSVWKVQKQKEQENYRGTIEVQISI